VISVLIDNLKKMLTIPNYQILNKIYESANSLIYSGFIKRDHKPLILKILKQDYPTPEELTHCRQEYDIIRSLANLDGVINAYGLEKHQNRLVMCLEDFGGESLDILTQKREFRVEELLTLAISITDNLGQAISDIIIKLLSKTAEERYQSAYGLKADLQECKARLARSQLEPFTLAQQDISDRFQIPQKLYGRKRDIETLLVAFERVANPPPSPLY